MKSLGATLLSSIVLAGVVALCVAVLLGNTREAQAQTEFKVALQKKYDGMTVSCNTCHVNGEEKKVRNDFGKLFAKELEGKKVTEKLAAVKNLESDDPARVKAREEATADFLVALKKVEGQTGPGGKTYAELLKAGKIDGVKPKE